MLCPVRPDSAVVGRAVEVLLRMALGAEAPVAVAGDPHGWVLHFGGAASASVTEAAPGGHEFADRWYLAVAPGAREPLAKLAALTTAASAAALYGGRLLDEAGVLSLPPDGDPAAALVRLLACPGATPEECLGRLLPPGSEPTD